MNGKQIWQAVLGELQIQMSRPDYETWLKDTTILSHEDGAFVVGVPTPFAKEWLENRLSSLIRRTLTRILGYSIEVRFVVHQKSLLGSPQEGAVSLARAVATAIAQSPSPAPSGLISPPRPDAGLNPRYSFDNYVVGGSNRLAHAACIAIVRAPAQAYNPLFLYGGVGLGKTHLLHAIGHAARQKAMAVLYVSSEKFTNEMINCIREQRMEDFRNKYRSLDLLMVDDIQFLAGKEGTQEEFFHTFNTLHEAGKQIVVSSDRPPKAILAMEDRLRSRLEWGLIADIQPPDLETRMAILQAKASSQSLSIPPEVTQFIAQRVQSNIRELEGSLNRVVAYADFTQTPLTIDVAMTALNDVLLHQRKASPSQVVEAVCQHYQLAASALKGKQRDKEIVLPRQVAMYLLRVETSASLPQIGEELGGRDHSTILHGYSKIANGMSQDSRLRQDVLSIQELLHPTANPTPARTDPAR